MLFTDAVYVGIDPTAGVKPMHYAAIDADLKVISLDKGNMESVLAFVAGLEAAIVAIDASQAPNLGLMLNAEVRRRYNLRPGGETWGKWRVCEYELRRRNIRLYNTPSTAKAAPRWMQNGFMLFRRLGQMGYRTYQAGKAIDARTMLEVHPHACFSVLLGRRPFLKRTLEGRMQRQLVLYIEGLDIPDPLHCLEEITRHHLLSSHLPLEKLYDHDELDALIAAYTAYLVGVMPERIRQVGDREEGLLTLPTAELKDFYQ